VGAGTLDLAQALKVAGKLAGTDKKAAALRADATQEFRGSTGQGSIDAARAGDYLVDADGVELSGEIDVQGTAWNPAAWWQATSTLTAWSGGQWLGVTWTGDDWLPAADGLTSHRWGSHRWGSHRWGSVDWSSVNWGSHRWGSHRWGSHRWGDEEWASSSWS
jgi:serine protease AprX